MRSVICCLATVMAFPAPAQGTLTGHVRDAAGFGIASAEVRIAGTPAAVYTDARGAFRVQGVPAGLVKLSARRMGFRPGTNDVTLGDGQTADVTIALDFTPQQLDLVRVTARREPYDARLAGFKLRSQKHVGTFITRERIEASGTSTFSDLLRSVPGVRVAATPTIRNAVRFRGAKCPPLVFIDGFAATAGEFDVDNIDPASVEGIEVYMGMLTVPPEFMAPRGLEQCGVIAVWSRPYRPRPRPETAASRARLQRMVEAAAVYTADEVDTPARLDQSSFTPVYPDSLWNAGTSGQAMVEFVIDSLGRIEMDYFSVVSESHVAFAEAVRAALTRARFSPAIKGGRRVRQIMQLPTHFDRPKP